MSRNRSRSMRNYKRKLAIYRPITSRQNNGGSWTPPADPPQQVIRRWVPGLIRIDQAFTVAGQFLDVFDGAIAGALMGQLFPNASTASLSPLDIRIMKACVYKRPSVTDPIPTVSMVTYSMIGQTRQVTTPSDSDTRYPSLYVSRDEGTLQRSAACGFKWPKHEQLTPIIGQPGFDRRTVLTFSSDPGVVSCYIWLYWCPAALAPNAA